MRPILIWIVMQILEPDKPYIKTEVTVLSAISSKGFMVFLSFVLLQWTILCSNVNRNFSATGATILWVPSTLKQKSHSLYSPNVTVLCAISSKDIICSYFLCFVLLQWATLTTMLRCWQIFFSNSWSTLPWYTGGQGNIFSFNVCL